MPRLRVSGLLTISGQVSCLPCLPVVPAHGQAAGQNGIARSWLVPGWGAPVPHPPWGRPHQTAACPAPPHTHFLPHFNRKVRARSSKAHPHLALSQHMFVVLELEGLFSQGTG